MRARTLSILVATGAALATAILMASCGAFSGSNSDNPPDASQNTSDASQDTVKDAGSTILDGGLQPVPGDGASCSSITLGSICDSFDLADGGFAAFWRIENSAGGSLGASPSYFHSPPSSLAVAVPEPPDADVSLFQDLVASINFHAHVTIDVDFYVVLDQTASGPYAEIVDIAFNTSTIQTARLAIGGGDIKAFINTYDAAGDYVTKVFSGSDPGATVDFHDQWHHAHVELYFSATSGGAALTIDAVDFPTTTGNITLPSMATNPTSLTVSVGDSPGPGASNVYLDNFVLTATD